MKKRICLALTFVFIMAGAAAAQKSFYNKEFKFGLKYPAGSKLIKDLDTIAATPDLKPLAYMSLKKPGRGLYEVAAYVSAANMTRAACRALSANEDNPRKKKFGTITFDKTTEIDGGMESVHPIEFYRTFHSGTCYEVRLMLAMDKYPKHPINESAAFARLYTILRTFHFR